MFAVLRKSRILQLLVDLHLQLFDSIVISILFYGSDLSCDIPELIHNFIIFLIVLKLGA